MLLPNFQFSTILQRGNILAMHEYHVPPENTINTITDLIGVDSKTDDNNNKKTVQMWQDCFSQTHKNIIQLINANPICKHLLASFGNVLANDIVQVDTQPLHQNLYPIGAMFSCPGGVLHAGPSSSSTRVILFFSGTPGKQPTMYDGDTQHNRTSLTTSIVKELLPEFHKNSNQQKKLLHLLVDEMNKESSKNYSRSMIRHSMLCAFLEKIHVIQTKKKPKKGETVDLTINKFQKDYDWYFGSTNTNQYWEGYIGD